jgi:hypothetical protein
MSFSEHSHPYIRRKSLERICYLWTPVERLAEMRWGSSQAGHCRNTGRKSGSVSGTIGHEAGIS